MDWATFNTAMEKIKRYPTITAIALNFAGEPLLNPHFAEMVQCVDNSRSIIGKRYRTSFSTNGMLLTPTIFDSIKDRFDVLNVSLDGIGEVNDRQRIGSRYETIAANLRHAIDSKRKRTKISVNTVITDQSPSDIAAFQTAWQDADILRTAPAHDNDLASLSPTNYCHELYHYSAILWNGDLTTCCGDLRGENVYGNIKEGLWGGPIGPLCSTCGRHSR